MNNRITCVSVDYDANSVRVFDQNGNYISTISRPGLVSAQASGACVTTVDQGHNVTTYDVSSGYPRQISNRVRSFIPSPAAAPRRENRPTSRTAGSQPSGPVGGAFKAYLRKKAIG